MALTLGCLFEAILLFVNALAVLHEERFLRKVGWAYNPADDIAYGRDSVKQKIASLLYSIRLLLRIPLIGVNTVYILYLLIFG